jgi:hypothetical protein
MWMTNAYHFVREEFVEAGLIKIIFVGTKDSDSDIFTNNISGDIHDEHVKKIMGTQENLEKKTVLAKYTREPEGC